MKLLIKPVTDRRLAESIQFYIFCSCDHKEKISYQTFPNTNLCLALYKSNRIFYNSSSNFCLVEDDTPRYTSRLWGFHATLFQVSIDATLDQVCILLHPAGLRNFTTIPYEELLNAEDPFTLIFGKKSRPFLEQLFEPDDTSKRHSLLEAFLALNLSGGPRKSIAHRSIQRIVQTKGAIRIGTLATELGINEATLYTHFISFVGQSPKDFIKTVRFRAALSAIKQTGRQSLTAISYAANYYDQAHFIKDFRQLTSYSPKAVRQKALIEQQQLIWIYND